MYRVAGQLTGVVEIGSLLSSIPDRPLPIAIVERLEEHDVIIVAVPIQTEEEKKRDQAITERFTLVIASVGVGETGCERLANVRSTTYSGFSQ